MKWNAYIAEESSEGVWETVVKEFDLPNTTRADKAYAIQHASKLYNVPEDKILCLPAPSNET